MEQLTFVDEHSIAIAATEATTWRALQSTIGDAFAPRLPRPLVVLWASKTRSPCSASTSRPPSLLGSGRWPVATASRGTSFVSSS